ncbi:unnamed protein product [Spirodela intermedia]|uniref:Uncharacterized protein n=1 Tax=Spirodela intermedia TaxID=51605 RepID=A0A7I8IG45_SPIIN|nr:unnamed protein product [Spirodela intermedia]CAA6656365.1 unnamed protein product [Spirodela intermedia]
MKHRSSVWLRQSKAASFVLEEDDIRKKKKKKRKEKTDRTVHQNLHPLCGLTTSLIKQAE